MRRGRATRPDKIYCIAGPPSFLGQRNIVGDVLRAVEATHVLAGSVFSRYEFH